MGSKKSRAVKSKKEEITFTSKLPSKAKWGIKDMLKFNDYVIRYDSIPSYKKLLNTMIKFKDMYQPISKPPMIFDYLGFYSSANEARSAKRLEIYMLKRDLINSFDEKEGRQLIVTSTGHKIFYESYPLAKLRKEKWNGVWTIVMYDFPESLATTRNLIRRRLMYFGFGTPQISILASPLKFEEPIKKYIEKEGLEKYIWVFRAEKILGLENKDIAEKSWPLGELNRLYRRLLQALPIAKNEDQLLKDWKRYFLAVNSADPYLPEELLPKDWLGEKCETEFLKIGPKGLGEIIISKLRDLSI